MPLTSTYGSFIFPACIPKCEECTHVARIFALPLNRESFMLHFQSVCANISHDAMRRCILRWR